MTKTEAIKEIQIIMSDWGNSDNKIQKALREVLKIVEQLDE